MLSCVTGNPFQDVLFGTAVTSVIEFSSATSMMCIGFVMRPAKSVMLGAILGTSITGWILCLGDIELGRIASLFSTVSVTCFSAIAGTILRVLHRKKEKAAGEALLGFAVLITGMSMM